MKKIFMLACLGCLFFEGARAQRPWKFRSDEWAGFVQGEMGAYGQVHTINGLYKRSWFLGIGTGLDYYRYRSVPLFLSVEKELVPGKNGFFISLDGGIDIPWYTRNKLSEQYLGISYSKFLAAPYWNAALGYRLRFAPHSRQALLLSAGYSYKELKEDQKGEVDCGFAGPCWIDPNGGSPATFDYRNRRVSVRLGWEF
jgi:hypothetical protein